MNRNNIGVLGGGKMGVGIAQLFAMKGHKVKIVYVGNDVERGDSAINMRANLTFLAENDVICTNEIEDIMNRVSYTEHIEELSDFANIVFECVIEKLEVKQDYFSKLDAICPVETILASNTSAISITQIAERSTHKERIIGTHFWNPPYLIPLVEVIRTEFVSEATVEGTFNILEQAGKKPVLVKKDVPGFLANRLQHALFREAISIVEHEIASPKDVDEAIKYGFGMRLGISAPFEVMDMGGLDLTYNIHSYLFPHIEDTHEAQDLIKRNLACGRLGFKSKGHGIQEWTEEEMKSANKNLNEKLIKVAKALDRM
ncbi:MAG: 3-hydroxyacyl-CoA dehydrogenase NAD-binding domain-containing protein [Sedimentibacter sp.]|uniref:3-hydroxyacyl-CoA dehydrogenase family protein n=1 Tax=Sedimentibacter sp. TaxID=1960295 RepID=UPI0031589F16